LLRLSEVYLERNHHNIRLAHNQSRSCMIAELVSTAFSEIFFQVQSGAFVRKSRVSGIQGAILFVAIHVGHAACSSYYYLLVKFHLALAHETLRCADSICVTSPFAEILHILLPTWAMPRLD
jgi:hypothetical protein